MPQYLSPGVYVEEVEAGSRPIEGVGTAVAAFVGLAAKGPYNAPTLITNWSQFTQTFGEFVEATYLAHSVYGYFLNGGGACYVVRIGPWPPTRSLRSRKARPATTSQSRSAPPPSPVRTSRTSSSPSARAARSRRSTTTSPPRRASRTSSQLSRPLPS
jgi:phage tail sheath protein FI